MEKQILTSELAIGDVIFPEFGPITEITRFFTSIAVRRADRRRNSNVKSKPVNLSSLDMFKKAFLAAEEEADCYAYVPGTTQVRFAGGQKREFRDGETIKLVKTFRREPALRRRRRRTAA